MSVEEKPPEAQPEGVSHPDFVVGCSDDCDDDGDIFTPETIVIPRQPLTAVYPNPHGQLGDGYHTVLQQNNGVMPAHAR